MISKEDFHMCIIELEPSKQSVNCIKIVVIASILFYYMGNCLFCYYYNVENIKSK